jgi:hypothetical protein
MIRNKQNKKQKQKTKKYLQLPPIRPAMRQLLSLVLRAIGPDSCSLVDAKDQFLE